MVSAIREARARVISTFLNRHYGARNRIFPARDQTRIPRSPPARDRIAKITRRTGRANAARSHKVSVIRDSENCVVADAVLVEPVSTAKFPANREINRECCRIAVLVASEAVNNGFVTGLSKRIPYTTEQGIILAEQGTLGARTGNFIGPELIIIAAMRFRHKGPAGNVRFAPESRHWPDESAR